MNFYCPNCKAYYTQPDEQIPPTGLTVKCLDCGTLISLPGPPARKTLAVSAESGSAGGATDDVATVTVGPSLEGLADMLAGVQQPGGQPARVPLPPGNQLEAGTQRPAILPAQIERSGQGASGAQAGFPEENELTVPAVGPGSVIQPTPAAPPGVARTVAPPRPAVGPAPVARGPAGPVPVPTWRLGQLWLAVRAAWSPRRLFETAAVLFATFSLIAFLGWLIGQSPHGAAPIVRLVTSVALGWLAFSLLNGGLSAALHAELTTGQPVSLGRGFRWAFSHLGSVTLTPLLVLGSGLALVAGVALLQLSGMIPGFGPMIYGATYIFSLLLAVFTSVSVIILVLVAFYYLPLLQFQDYGPVSTLRSLLKILRDRGGKAIGLLLVSSLYGLVVFFVVFVIGVSSLIMTNAMGYGLLGAEYFKMLSKIPGPIYYPLDFIMQFLKFSQWVPYSAVEKAQTNFDAGIFLLSAGLLFWIAVIVAFILIFLSGSGLISFYILSSHKREIR